jgi:hypothetical protein
MGKKAEAETIETTAEGRLKELSARLAELEEQRRRITEGMGEVLRKDKVEAILQGGDPDLVMKDHEEALTSIDNKLVILRAAIREQHALADREHAARRRAELEKDRPLYIQAVRRYVQAVRDLHAAQEALQGHEAYKVSPLSFPGLHLQGYERRERAFAETLRVRGIDPEEVGIDLSHVQQ